MAHRGKLSRSFEKFEASSSKLKKALEKEFGEGFEKDILIEVVTKRFEYTFESLWKFLRELLLEEGIEQNSPLGCFKEAFSLGLIDKKYEDVFPVMVKKRNEIVHIYSDEDAGEIYLLIKNTFAEAILDVLERSRSKLS